MKCRRFLVSLVVAWVATGCGASRQTKIAGGSAMMVVGGLLVAYSPDDKCHSDLGPDDGFTRACTELFAEPGAKVIDVATTVLGVALIAAGGGLVISGTADSHAPAPEPIARDDERLALDASAAARAGQCESAKSTATELSLRDRAVFDQLIANDSALARCYGGY